MTRNKDKMKMCTQITAFLAKCLIFIGLYDHINQIPKDDDAS